MSDPVIRKVWPDGEAHELTDDELATEYAFPTDRGWVRANFISSVDGSATHDGLSGGLGNAADKRVFDLLRRLSDVVVVGAGTVRAEGYGALRLDDASVRWRDANGLASQPTLVIVSNGLDLRAEHPIFREAPVRPIVVTAARSSETMRRRVGEVAEVMVCGEDRVQTPGLFAGLAARGLRRIHSEGGPHLFGVMIAEDAVDELCLTVSPQLEGGAGGRIAAGATPAVPRGMRLAHVMVSGDTLLLRYLRG